MPKAKAEKLVRRGDFMSQPSQGWLHASEGLAIGKGVFYSYPVRYIGSIQIMRSLRDLGIDDKTICCREAIIRCIEGAKLRKPRKRKLPKNVQAFLTADPYVRVMELKLNISIEGIATSDLQTNAVMSNDPISKISFAAGGEDEDYDYFTYVAKDKKDNRYCHVFDCGILADDVLATVGQTFNIVKDVSGGDTKVLKGAAALAAAPKLDNPMYFAFSQQELQSMQQQQRVGVPPKPPTARPAQIKGAQAALMGKRVVPQPPVDGEVYEDMQNEDIYDNDNGRDQPQAQVPQEEYDVMPSLPRAVQQENYEVYDDPDAVARPQEIVGFLNQNVVSQHLYGDCDDLDQDRIYGDGQQAGWGYLDMDPEQTYGGLADVLYGDGK